ncbi:TPA: MotA/TolQ/ExbB proton channel family protein [Candidatus Poribacteria bacterium]|nr:MotA/TolQ/ExbB proton channel family protein [Candidatus Poribacteria bacterium]
MGNPLGLLQAIIYAISSSLLYPVMVLLIVLAAWMVIFAGGFFAEWIGRKRLKKNVDITQYLSQIQREKELPESVKMHLPLRVRIYVEKLTSLFQEKDDFFQEKVETLIQEEEMRLTKEVDRTRLVVRIGPSLGLMGTLIPMGVGLAALGQGDIAQMTSSLIIAFTTTVVGLALGILAYFFTTIKGRWVQEDIRDIELITEAMTREGNK